MNKSTKTALIVAGILFAVGAAVCAVAFLGTNFNISKLLPADTSVFGAAPVYGEKVCDGDAKELDIALTVNDVTVGRSSDGRIHIGYYLSESVEYEFSEEDGRISMRRQDTGIPWYRRITFGFDVTREDVRVLLPEDFAGELSIATTTGEVEITGLAFEDTLTVRTTTGDISVRELKAERIDISARTGEIGIRDISAKEVTLSASTGEVSAEGLAADTVSISTTTGDVRFDALSANSIGISATTGTVRGSIAGKSDDYTVESHTSTGDNNLPERWGAGEKKLTVTTSTGDIRIDFE